MSAQLDVRVDLRLLTPDPIAGSVCEVECAVEVTGGRIELAVGRERGTGRSAFLEVAGRMDGVTLEDPAAGSTRIGGPSGTVPVEPGTRYREPVLLNQYLRLERVRDLLAPGQRGMLELEWRRQLTLSGDRSAGGRLRVPMRRNDAALEAEVADLAGQLRAAWRAATSNELEDALAALAAMRLPAARAALAALAGHPNPLVRAEANRAATATPAP